MKIEITVNVEFQGNTYEDIAIEINNQSLDEVKEMIYFDHLSGSEDDDFNPDEMTVTVTDYGDFEDLKSLETLCEYSQYSGYYEDDPGLIIAAYNCDIEPDDIDERYAGKYDDDEDFAETLLKDTGDLPNDLPWYICINWERTASNIMADYTEDGGYYFRNC